MTPITAFLIALSLSVAIMATMLIVEITTTRKEEKRHKEKISEVLPGTCWKVKKQSFEKDNNPFDEYYETIYKVLDIRENKIGKLYVRIRQGKLLENGETHWGDKIEVIKADDFVDISDKINK